MRSFWFEANYLAAGSFLAFRCCNLAHKLWCYVPVLPVVGDDRDRLLVVSGEHANDQGVPSRLKTNAIANSELQHLGVGFVSLTEALDLTTPAGRAMAGLLAVFAEFERDILRERVRAGLAQARQQGKQLGRPPSVVHNAAEVRKLCRQGISKSEIARRLEIGRTSVRRLLTQKKS